MWKSAYVGVYQLLNWTKHGETLKLQHSICIANNGNNMEAGLPTSIGTVTYRMVNWSIMVEDEYESDRVWHLILTSSAAGRNFFKIEFEWNTKTQSLPSMLVYCHLNHKHLPQTNPERLNFGSKKIIAAYINQLHVLQLSCHLHFLGTVKVKQSRYRPAVAQRVPRS